MPNNDANHGWAVGKKLNRRCAQMPSNNLFQTFCFQGQLYFICFFQKLKQKYNLFIFTTTDKL